MAQSTMGERRHDEWLLVMGAVSGAAGLALSLVVPGVDGRVGFALEVLGLAFGLLYFLRRWMPPAADLFEHGYHAGWDDCQARYTIYPVDDPVVTPLRRR